MSKLQQYLDEVKATSITMGKVFTLSDDIGKFKVGEKVIVDEIKSFGNDIEVHLSNESGVTDTFYLDRNDDFEELM
jgi:hypothetical protein